MRRQSFSSSLSSGSGGAAEPLIVVEESTLGEDEFGERSRSDSPPRCLDPDSPSLNPFLLSPWREARKASLPTPQCTSGITASQVRRLSERGGEGSGPSAREAAFLATLSQSTPPQPGGRRHSVVTISRVPPTLFGRTRRESIAAFPMGGVTRVLPNRRDSVGPPSNSGSTHNLALDIMDDIAEIKAARKVRLKMWKTGSRERVCEVQPLEGDGCTAGPQRYTQQQRRFSDFSLTTIPAGSVTRHQQQRRASEMPRGPPPPIPPRATAHPAAGIVCTNTDLISILSSLTSSATEIDRCGADDDRELPPQHASSSSVTTTAAAATTAAKSQLEHRRNRLKSSRSNSFDVSILYGCGDAKQSGTASALSRSGAANNTASIISPSSWFVKRHQPMAKKQPLRQTTVDSPSEILSFRVDKSRVVQAVKDSLVPKTLRGKDEVVWDGTSGTKVDAQVLGNAIEEYLRSSAGSGPDPVTEPPNGSGRPPQPGPKAAAWFGGSGSGPVTPAPSKDDEQADSCEPSICSSLKDLFVK